MTKFELSHEEKLLADNFIKEHKDCQYKSSIGGKISYEFTPTGVGTIKIIKCNSCKTTLNVTDFSRF
jgi:hypothetical protein